MEINTVDNRYVSKRLCVSGIFADEIASYLPICTLAEAEQP